MRYNYGKTTKIFMASKWTRIQDVSYATDSLGIVFAPIYSESSYDLALDCANNIFNLFIVFSCVFKYECGIFVNRTFRRVDLNIIR